MENAVVIFPFLCLHFTERQRVLRSMDCNDRLAFSLYSKQISIIVKSLTLKIEFIDLRLNSPIELVFRFPEMMRSRLLLGYGEGSDKLVDRAPESVILSTHEQHQTTIRSSRTLRDWIFHIFDVYHGSCIRIFRFYNQSIVYNFSSIETALQGIETRLISFIKMINEELFKKVIETFLPAKRISIDTDNQPENQEYSQRFSLQNFDVFCATAPRIPYFSTLNRFLSINASFISTDSTMTDTTINRSLKLWIRGAMPRLKRLVMFYGREGYVLKKDAILNGINYIQRDPDHVQSGSTEWYFGPEPVMVKGGLSILKFDCTKATIQFWERENNVICMDLIVWDE